MYVESRRHISRFDAVINTYQRDTHIVSKEELEKYSIVNMNNMKLLEFSKNHGKMKVSHKLPNSEGKLNFTKGYIDSGDDSDLSSS